MGLLKIIDKIKEFSRVPTSRRNLALVIMKELLAQLVQVIKSQKKTPK